MKKQHRNIYITVGIVAVLLIVLGASYMKHRKASELQTSSDNQDQQIEDFGKAVALNGTKVEEAKVQRPFAVVIENHPDARPQSGLSEADLVYEALAEGGITRFLAIFQSQDVKSIGPVRSARTYFNDWAQEWGAVYVHVGGNIDALNLLDAGVAGISNADQYYNGDYFTRITTRPAPHNVYTSIDKLKALSASHSFSIAKSYTDYIFKDDAPAQTPDASKITIDFSMPSFMVQWVYDSSTNTYKRYIAGSAALDNGNKQYIFAKNLIVQRVTAQESHPGDPKLALLMGTHTGGEADVYQDGTVVHGTWKYLNGKTRYYDSSGKEIALNRGQIWIDVVPPDRTVSAK